jgi:hypothetical protein
MTVQLDGEAACDADLVDAATRGGTDQIGVGDHIPIELGSHGRRSPN